MANYDSPWKESLDVYFKSFMAFCFPDFHDQIDWSRGYESREQELIEISPKGVTGQRTADKLIRICLLSGQEKWVMIHVEVQSQPETDFEKRMFTYHSRILDRYNEEVVSLAVLGDDRPNWRPSCYQHELHGCRLEFQFPIVKLLDYSGCVEELEQSENPFAVLVLAHLKSQETLHYPIGPFNLEVSPGQGIIPTWLECGPNSRPVSFYRLDDGPAFRSGKRVFK